MDTSAIRHIIREMQMLYGNAFKAKWGDIPLRDMEDFWERKLAGFSREELGRGFKALAKQKYPPTLPEFMALCRPPVDNVKAYHEAVKGLQERRLGRKGEWSHPAIFWAASRMAFDLLNHTYQQCKARFERELDRELEATTWQEIPEASHALPPPKVDREKAKADAEAALQRIGYQQKKADRGDTGWIHRNLTRLQEGWKPTVAVRQAILDGAKALGIPVPEGV